MTESNDPPSISDASLATLRGVREKEIAQSLQSVTALLVQRMPQHLPIIPESVNWHATSESMAQGGSLIAAVVADAPGQEGIFTPGERKIVIAKVLPGLNENDRDWRNREIAQTKRAGRAVPIGVVQTLAISLMKSGDSMGLLVSKWYPRGSLREVLLNGTMTREQILSFVERSGDALTTLHALNPDPIYHKDVKPANFLVNVKGEADLADFDMASTVWKGDTFGTPPYASPETLLSVATKGKSDVFSWNTMVYQMIAGNLRQSPYPGYDARHTSLNQQQRSNRVNTLRLIHEAGLRPTSEWIYAPIVSTQDLEQRGFTPHTIKAVNEVLEQGLSLIEDKRPTMPDSTLQMAEALSLT